MTDLVERFAANAVAAGYTVHRRVTPEIEGAGYSEASYGIAETGSLVFLSSHEPRASSLLPAVHVATLREDRILPDLETLFETIGPALPSGVAVVTGPSRSADIEQVLAVGVHGPGEVHVVLEP
jgi:L-lactate dehydrogenase complex protein LldG